MLISLALSLLAADPACDAAFETLRTTNGVESGYSAHVGFVRARIGPDGEPVWLLLDTGANRSALDEGFAARSGLPVLAGSQVEGTAGVIEAGGTRVEDLRLGELALPPIEPTTSDISGLQGPGGEAAVGILGSDALAGLVVTLDFAHGRIAVAPPSEASTRAGGCGRAVATTDDNGILRLEAVIDGETLPLRYDSGAGLFEDPHVWINLSQGQWARVRGERPETAPIATLGGSGTGGQVSLPVHAGGRLEIGPLAWDEPRLIVQPAQGYFARPEAVGFVGNALFWSQGMVTIDYPGQRLILPPAD
ncbi:MAG: aspartyl protease family protein [Brevundimonas sp.]|nr:aspartyl protease family protein [Brevundimonas sp.]